MDTSNDKTYDKIVDLLCLREDDNSPYELKINVNYTGEETLLVGDKAMEVFKMIDEEWKKRNEYGAHLYIDPASDNPDCDAFDHSFIRKGEIISLWYRRDGKGQHNLKGNKDK